MKINDAVKQLARVDWRTNTVIHKNMNQAIEDIIWDFSDEYGFDVSIDEIDLLLESAMKTAMSRY